MVLLLRNTALRISDVATFPKDAVSWDPAGQTWRIRLRTQKSGEPVYLPIPRSVKLALDAVPAPRNASEDCPYFFWNGNTARRAVVGIAERTLSAVFRKSGVKNAHAHRFRHTLATRLLERGPRSTKSRTCWATPPRWSAGTTASGRRAVRPISTGS
jgi:integrase